MQLKRQPLSLAKKINIGLLGGLIILAAVGVISMLNMRSLVIAADAREQSIQAQAIRNQLMACMIDAETGQRGYIITGNETFLDPYQTGIQTYTKLMGDLRSSAAPHDENHIAQIDALFKQKIAHMETSIELRKTQGFTAAQARVSSGEGKELMDEIRGIMEHLQTESTQEVAQHAAETQRRIDLTTWTVRGGMLFAALVVITSIILINRDLVARKKLQDALAASEAQLKAVIDNMAEGLVVADVNAKFQLFNKAAERILGAGLMQVSPEKWAETYGNYLPDKVTPFPTEQFPLIRALKGETVHGTVMYVKNKQAERGLFISVTGSPLRDAEGKIIGSIAVFDDITQQKQAQEKLYAEKEQDDAILSGIGDGVFVVDKSGIIKLFNPAAQVLSGLSAAEAIGLSYKEVLRFRSEKNDSPADQFVDKALSGHHAEMASRTVLVKKDGSRLPVADSAAPIFDTKQNVTGAVVVFRDVSKERQLERIKDEFVAIASHELRTPMTAIRGMASMILKGDYGKISAELKDPVHDILLSTERLITLVNDLLDLSRIEAGRMKFMLEDADLKPLTEEVISQLQPIAKDKHITLSTNISTATTQVDTAKYKQILHNLLGNALKFTDSGSITVTATRDDKNIKIFVADTGIGIAEFEKRRIFGKFQQISSQQNGRPAGTGLGLYISREIIRKMGGDMWLEAAELGKGSTFAFSLPLSGSKAAQQAHKVVDTEAKTHPDQK